MVTWYDRGLVLGVFGILMALYLIMGLDRSN
jgi:hypothetical protein